MTSATDLSAASKGAQKNSSIALPPLNSGRIKYSKKNSVSTDRTIFGIPENTNDKKVMLVFVVGGLSYLEIAAFRYISNDPYFPYTIVMATTKVINGSTFLESMSHRVA